jgi:hypothetical protein
MRGAQLFVPDFFVYFFQEWGADKKFGIFFFFA